MKILKHFEEVTPRVSALISAGWILFVLGLWFISSMSERHLFPTLFQVGEGLRNLYAEGLVRHIFSSLWLCVKSIVIATFISLVLVYLSPMPLVKPVTVFLSKFRYLPLTGITFYFAMMTSTAREMQTWVLVMFMSTFFITSLLGILNDIPQEEFDHARAMKCNRREILVRVIIFGRLDYVLEVLRQNLAIVWMMLVTVESILVAAGGIGVLIKNSEKFMNHGRIVALQLIILILGLCIDWVLRGIRKAAFPYSKF